MNNSSARRARLLRQYGRNPEPAWLAWLVGGSCVGSLAFVLLTVGLMGSSFFLASQPSWSRGCGAGSSDVIARYVISASGRLWRRAASDSAVPSREPQTKRSKGVQAVRGTRHWWFNPGSRGLVGRIVTDEVAWGAWPRRLPGLLAGLIGKIGTLPQAPGNFV